MTRFRKSLIWGSLAAAVLLPIALAATSPLLAWRQPIYIIAGFAGIVGMALLLIQPLLAGGYLPGWSIHRSRRIHRWAGSVLAAAVVVHVVGLWITSPPDVIDALLFASPTPFSAWGVLAMWAIFAAGLLAALRHRLPLTPRSWRRAHTLFVIAAVIGSVIHAVLIEGTMEPVTKIALCGLVLAATVKVSVDLRIWTIRSRRNE
ncbi:MAG: ferric reductase-like transmembrane domain-containing protein [Rhizobiaceae bacterium]